MKKSDDEVLSRYIPIRIIFVGVETSDNTTLRLLEKWLENRNYSFVVFLTTFNVTPDQTFSLDKDTDFVLIFGDCISEDNVSKFKPDIIFNFGGTNYKEENLRDNSTSSSVTEEGMLHYNVIDMSKEVTAIEKEQKADKFLLEHDEILMADAANVINIIDINSRKNYLSIDEKFYIVIRTLGRFLYL